MTSPQNGVAVEETTSGAEQPSTQPAGQLPGSSAATQPVRAGEWRQWLASRQLILAVSCSVVAAALLAGAYFAFLAPVRKTEPETLAAKTDFRPSASTGKESLKVVSGQAEEEPANTSGSPKGDMLAGVQPQAPAQWLPDRALMSDTRNWIPVSKQSEFRTFFFREVNAKGSADARLAMLTNFSAARTLPGNPSAYLSVLYVISIDCTTSLGVPVSVIWNTGKFAGGDDIPNPMPPQNAKKFAPDDPMFLFACK